MNITKTFLKAIELQKKHNKKPQYKKEFISKIQLIKIKF